MKHILRIAAVAMIALSVAGCVTIDRLTSAQISPEAVYVARNTFGVAEVTATKYLEYCHVQTVKPQFCAKSNELAVARAVRSGRDARNQLTAYVKAHPDAVGAKGLYDAVLSATDLINQITAEYKGAVH